MAKLSTDIKLSTGIKGLDDILGDGIPQGHNVLLAGSAGTGKTIMSTEFLFAGAKAGETVMYIAFAEPRDKILKNLEGFSFFDKSLIDDGKVKIVDITTDARLSGIDLRNVESISIESLVALFRDIITNSGATRVVLDSITAISSNLGSDKNIRDFIFGLGLQLSYMNCTMIMISEIPPQTFVYSINGVEEFISDGVILLTEFERKGDLLRSLQVIKMRGVDHSRNKHIMKITSNGIKLVPMFKAGIE